MGLCYLKIIQKNFFPDGQRAKASKEELWGPWPVEEMGIGWGALLAPHFWDEYICAGAKVFCSPIAAFGLRITPVS